MNLGTLISTYWWALTAAALLVISYLSWKLFHLSKQVAVEMDRIERALTASKACYWEWSVILHRQEIWQLQQHLRLYR